MRVLLIDDHTLVRKGLEQLLQSRGVDVVASAGSGREGIEAALALKPDVILLDVKMPEMSGTETLKHLRAAGVTAPILMLTMSRDEKTCRRRCATAPTVTCSRTSTTKTWCQRCRTHCVGTMW